MEIGFDSRIGTIDECAVGDPGVTDGKLVSTHPVKPDDLVLLGTGQSDLRVERTASRNRRRDDNLALCAAYRIRRCRRRVAPHIQHLAVGAVELVRIAVLGAVRRQECGKRIANIDASDQRMDIDGTNQRCIDNSLRVEVRHRRPHAREVAL